MTEKYLVPPLATRAGQGSVGSRGTKYPREVPDGSSIEVWLHESSHNLDFMNYTN